MPDNSKKPVAPRVIQALIGALVVGLVGGGYLTHLLTRPDPVAAGTFVDGSDYGVPSSLARFDTPAGEVAVQVSVPRREVEPDYGHESVRLDDQTRAVLVQVSGNGADELGQRGGVALIAGDERYDLAQTIGDPSWLVVASTERDLTVELEWESEHQRVTLPQGKAERGVAAGLRAKRQPQLSGCRVFAIAPDGSRERILKGCPTLYLSESVWSDRDGWVDDPAARWVDVYGVYFNGVALRNGDMVDPGGIPSFELDGAPMKQVEKDRWRVQADEASTALRVSSPASRWKDGRREGGWQIRADFQVEVAR